MPRRQEASPDRRGLDRRQWLTAAFALPLSAALSACREPEAGDVEVAEEVADEMQQRVATIIEAYDGQGIHRTGTLGDQACARWLRDEVRSLGVQSELESMPFERIDSEACYVEVGAERWEGVPLFDGPLSSADGVSGTLGRSDDPGSDIGFIEIPPGSAGGDAFHAYRRETSHSAIVAVTGGERWNVPPGLALCNAESYREPYGPPTIQVSTEALPALEGAATNGISVRLLNHGARTPTEVFNTVARVAGSDPSLAPLVVMTPRSGWWECASERGGGIAVWMEMIRALAAAAPLRPAEFVASTGHELGHYGLDHYIESREALIGDAVAWIHLGANFGAARGGAVLYQASDEKLRALGLGLLNAEGVSPARETPITERPLGEARNVYDGGGKFISILGGNGLFHHPADRWPEAVDLPLTASVARAFAAIAVELTKV